MIANWHDLEPTREAVGPIEYDGWDLGTAAGTVEIGVTRARILPRRQSSPVHVEVAEEEIFYVLDGSGLSWQDGKTYDVRRGDAIVHVAGAEAHTLVAGADGLDVLAFGERATPALTWLPRPRVARMGISLHVPQLDPWALEAEQGELDVPDPGPRPANIVNADELEGEDGWAEIGVPAGSMTTGMMRRRVPPGELNNMPHCHAVEEEIFVVLEGSGTLELTPSPTLVFNGAEPEAHAVRAGDVVSRPGSTRMAHTFRAGADGLLLLQYGQRRPNDIVYYPRSNKINFRGVGVIARLDALSWEEGEESQT